MPVWQSLKTTISEWTGYLVNFVQSYWFTSRRSRRKGGGGAGATTATTAAAGQAGRGAGGMPPSLADKENLDYRATAPKKRQPARDEAGGSSCSSGSSGADGSISRRYHRHKGKVGPGDGTAVRESRSADLASISSASGAATLAVCDTISEADFEQLVILPPSMDFQEWLASHMLALFHHVNALYGAVCEFCTKESCPVMCGPGNIQFLWVDDKNKKVKYPAPQYVDCVMSFAERTVRSEDTFPTKFGNEFPVNFESMLKKLCRLLYHVLAHLHAAHWEHLRVLGVGSQAAAVHWHLAAFARQFQMLESKDAAGLVELTNYLRSMNVADDSVMSATTLTGSGDDYNDEEREPMDAGTSEPPPRLQEANAQLQ